MALQEFLEKGEMGKGGGGGADHGINDALNEVRVLIYLPLVLAVYS